MVAKVTKTARVLETLPCAARSDVAKTAAMARMAVFMLDRTGSEWGFRNVVTRGTGDIA